MSGENILTCDGGTLSTAAGGEPLCVGGTWQLDGNSAFWDLALTSPDLAQLLGAVLFTFALVWCFKVLYRVMFNHR